MILPDFILESRKNKIWTESGMDTLEHCADKTHFKNYPHSVIYNYNSRGFRDSNWPDSGKELQNAIWCIGDSFTVGLGSPENHMWVNILQERINKRCINVSLDGASNHWMARKTLAILKEIQPKFIIIHWSFFTRGEMPGQDLDDEQRRLNFYDLDLTSEQLLVNFIELVQSVEQAKQDTTIIHSFIPSWSIGTGGTSVQEIWNRLRGSNWPTNPTNQITDAAKEELQRFGYGEFFKLYCDLLDNITYVPELNILDLARDGFHYDKVTATNFVDRLEKLIPNPDLS